MSENENLACGIYYLTHAAEGGNETARAVLAELDRLHQFADDLAARLLRQAHEAGALRRDNAALAAEAVKLRTCLLRQAGQLTYAEYAAAVNKSLAGECSKQGGCTCPADNSEADGYRIKEGA